MMICRCFMAAGVWLLSLASAQDLNTSSAAGAADEQIEVEAPALAREPENPAGSAYEEQLFLDGAVRALMRELDVLGAVVSVVQDGEVIARGGWGYADVERTKPMDPARTLVRPGSISKTFTWTLVMMLAEEGKLDLDADVNTYLDGFALESPFDEPVTMRAILAHQAGFEDSLRGLITRDQRSTLRETMAQNQPRLINPPFEAPSYSNYATALAGLIVGNIEGKPFNEVVEERLLTPLGMTRSTFREPLPEALAPDVSDSPSRRGGQFVDGGFEYVGSFGPAGSLSATADDMSRYMRAHLNDGAFGGTQIFSADVAQKLREPLFRAGPGMRAMLHGFRQTIFGDGFAYGHGGSVLGFRSQMSLHPASGTGLFVSFTGPEGKEAAQALAKSFGASFLGQEPPPRPQLPEGYQTPKEVLGTYRSLRMNFSMMEKFFSFYDSDDVKVMTTDDGALIVGWGSGPVRYVPLDNPENRVFVSVDDPAVRIAFDGQDAEQSTYLYVNPRQALRRIGTWESVAVHGSIQLLGIIVLIWSIIAGLKRVPAALSATGTEQLAGFSIVAAGVIFIVFYLGFMKPALNASGEQILAGLPMLNFWLSLSLAGAVLTGLAVLTIVPVWLGGTWEVFSKLTFTVQALVLAIFVWSLSYWNLIGPWNA